MKIISTDYHELEDDDIRTDDMCLFQIFCVHLYCLSKFDFEILVRGNYVCEGISERKSINYAMEL